MHAGAEFYCVANGIPVYKFHIPIRSGTTYTKRVISYGDRGIEYTQQQNRRQQTSSGEGGGTFHPGHPSSPNRSIPSTQPKQGGGGSYWDWLKSGGGLNPKNPYHPFPGATSPIPRAEAPEIPAWGQEFPNGSRLTIA